MQKLQYAGTRQINEQQTISKHNCIFKIHTIYFLNI